MKQCHCLLFLLFFSALALTALPARGYEILLDLDTDDNPATINETTWETSALVKMVLWPTTPGETIGRVEFGLGGTCWLCPPDDLLGIGTFGTSFDLFAEEGWVTAPGFDSGALYPTFLGCGGAGGPTGLVLLWFEPKSGAFTLDEPMFICAFNAWVNTVPPDCIQPPSDLMAIYDSGMFDYWNRVLLNSEVNATETDTWGGIKSIYR
jgi:hypothetical protein